MLVFCGVLPEEQERKQPFGFEFDLYLDLSQAGDDDDLTSTANYGAVVDLLVERLASERFQLLERMATRAIELIFDETPLIESITMTVRKLRPPVASHLDSTGVRLHRSRP